MRPAREASDSAQLLDTAVRDYLSNGSAGRGRLRDLTVLSTGAARVRRIARLLEDPGTLVRLEPVAEGLPRLERARDAFDCERRARVGWYESLGESISRSVPSPAPERSAERDGGAGTRADGELAAVVLEGAAGGGLQPGLAIAWAQRHLDVLAELESTLSAAYARMIDGGESVEASG